MYGCAHLCSARVQRGVAILLMLAAPFAGLGPAQAAVSADAGIGVEPAVVSWTRAAAVSGTTAWATGVYQFGTGGSSLIEGWNGSSWSVQSSANPGALNILNGVAATTASNAWAVGVFTSSGFTDSTLIERWNGSTWSLVPSPNVGTQDDLLAVAAASGASAWAVGAAGNPGRTLI